MVDSRTELPFLARSRVRAPALGLLATCPGAEHEQQRGRSFPAVLGELPTMTEGAVTEVS